MHPDLVGIKTPHSTISVARFLLICGWHFAIVISDPDIKAVFDTYSRFEWASGSKRNSSKCKGLWLGFWRGRLDLPVAIDWSCDMIKVLWFFIGFGDLDATNWNPCNDAVSQCLTSWRMRSLLYNGRALVANTLALSRIWYVASLVHMPNCVLKKLY